MCAFACLLCFLVGVCFGAHGSSLKVLVIVCMHLWCGMVWYGMVWYGMVWYGLAFHCIVCMSFSICKKDDMISCRVERLYGLVRTLPAPSQDDMISCRVERLYGLVRTLPAPSHQQNVSLISLES